MAIFYNKTTLSLVSADTNAGNTDSNLILIKDKEVDRTLDLPVCEPIYIKFVDNFPVEMTQPEKDVVDSDAILPAIKSAYEGYEYDGIEYYKNLRAELVLEYKLTNLTAENIYEIESKLRPVSGNLKSGDWMTAGNELTNVTVGGALTQTLYDQITTDIADYITNNYS